VVTQEWFTVGEAAEYLRVSKRTIYKLCQDGLLVGHRIGKRGHWRFRKKELDNALKGSIKEVGKTRRYKEYE
jgi:excisionase family DNA binding protein